MNIPRAKYVLIAAAVAVTGNAPALANTVTVATFADPSADSAAPLFTVDLVNDRITGGWLDGAGGLTLDVPASGSAYAGAFFTLTDDNGVPGISYTEPGFIGLTGPGIIRFFEAGANTMLDAPLVRVDFDMAQLSIGGLAAWSLMNFSVVDITGTAVPAGLTEESFGFSFANQTLSSPDLLTATAAFTSSAIIPEPSMVTLLAIGCVRLIGRRRRA